MKQPYLSFFAKKVEGTLIKIWKFLNVFVFMYKQYPENFAFLNLGIIELYTRKVCEIFVYSHTENIEYIKN